MNIQLFRRISFFLIISILTACGDGGGGEPETPGVRVTVALRCAIDVGGTSTALPLPIPDDCAAEEIDGDRYETDQNAIYLSGVSFKPKSSASRITSAATSKWRSNSIANLAADGYTRVPRCESKMKAIGLKKGSGVFFCTNRKRLPTPFVFFVAA